MGEVKGPIHAHCAWFGSELACEICNPACYQNHKMSNPNHLQFCGHPDCPLNPERLKKKLNPAVSNATLWKSFNYVCSVLADGSSTNEQELTDTTPDNKPPSEIERMKRATQQ